MKSEKEQPVQVRPRLGDIQLWLVRQLSEMVDVAPGSIDIKKPFTSYGLSSREAVSFIGDIEQWLGFELEDTLIYDYPNIDSLANHLVQL